MQFKMSLNIAVTKDILKVKFAILFIFRDGVIQIEEIIQILGDSVGLTKFIA